MKKINFEITEQDIKEYLKQHSEDQTIKYREAMFVKYMKEQQDITCESLEILMKKYNWEDRIISGTYHYDNLGILKQESLSDFNSYLNGIQNLDISGICHILIPAMKYYGQNPFHVHSLYANLNMVSDQLVVPMNHPMEVIESTLENYKFCEKVETYEQMINIRMGREYCGRQLLAYQNFYDEGKVKRIRKIIRERV